MQLMGVEVSGTSKFKNLKFLQYLYVFNLPATNFRNSLQFCSLQLK